MCQYCSRGLTPQRHQAHEEKCACKKEIAWITHQQWQLEAYILSEAILNAKRNAVKSIDFPRGNNASDNSLDRDGQPSPLGNMGALLESLETSGASVELVKHPRASAHSCLLEPESSQLTSAPQEDSPSPSSMPFRPFASYNDYVFADELIWTHASAKSIDQLLSTYPPGHLTFRNHKDLFQVVDQAA
ncbi:uncharacterized protein EI90DRAFT_3125533 [Cantharellus anzutake]|uniref:uncharacterized protein n=1 Tax=Cantharellus anzutake TaxID=1750568 RepID=UPI0019075041|nr:uncharacterized protein EI90DRAFT_3125533 [Cantharellus anzutake]KAF8328792.1 hypothetical protein EI90DRAFT_3125533 [Cantharellus anzutake]